MKQPRKCKVNIDSQTQIHFQRITAQFCPRGRAALLTSWALSCPAGSPSNWRHPLPVCVLVASQVPHPTPGSDIQIHVSWSTRLVVGTHRYFLSSALALSCKKKENKSWSKTGCRVAPFFCEYSRFAFYRRASTDFWFADDMAIILLKRATTVVVVFTLLILLKLLFCSVKTLL